MSTTNYEKKHHCTYIIAYSFKRKDELRTGEYVSYREDALDALLEARKNLLVSGMPEFQMRVKQKHIY